jgi:hypothetical protein
LRLIVTPRTILIAVQNLLHRNREPAPSFVERSTESITVQLRSGPQTRRTSELCANSRR